MVSAVLIVVALMLLATELKFGTYGASALIGAILLSVATIIVMRESGYFHPALAIAVPAALAIIAAFQGYLGLRARKNVRLAGLEELIGETGVSRTEIGKGGTVLVRGEYWQAKSQETIPAGTAIIVERVQGLLLSVRETGYPGVG